MGFIESNINPCLYAKESVNSLVHVALYVHDNLMVGNHEAIDEALETQKEYVLFVLQSEALFG